MNPPPFEQFSVHSDPSTVGTRWQKYVSRLENMFTGFNITEDNRKRALLLYYSGDEVGDIFDTLPDTGTDYSTAKTALTKHFQPSKSTEYERYVFRQSKQQPDETTAQYHTRLQHLAVGCQFDKRDEEIKSQIIQGCSSQKLRRYALREEKLTLSQLLHTARAYELANEHAEVMEKDSHQAGVSRRVELFLFRSLIFNLG